MSLAYALPAPRLRLVERPRLRYGRPPRRRPCARGGIVVGVDGSAEGMCALRWALAEARVRRVGLTVVHAFGYPPIAAAPGFVAAVSTSPDMLAYEGWELVRRAVVDAGGGSAGVRVDSVVAIGAAADVLTDAAEGADLLVVGSRGRGDLAALLLGSVGRSCARRASCPVVIVPATGSR